MQLQKNATQNNGIVTCACDSEDQSIESFCSIRHRCTATVRLHLQQNVESTLRIHPGLNPFGPAKHNRLEIMESFFTSVNNVYYIFGFYVHQFFLIEGNKFL